MRVYVCVCFISCNHSLVIQSNRLKIIHLLQLQLVEINGRMFFCVRCFKFISDLSLFTLLYLF